MNTAKEVAAELGCSKSHVLHLRARHGLGKQKVDPHGVAYWTFTKREVAQLRRIMRDHPPNGGRKPKLHAKEEA